LRGGRTLEGRRAPQGLDAEDRIALGLSAQHLAYLVISSLVVYTLLTSHLPGVVEVPGRRYRDGGRRRPGVGAAGAPLGWDLGIDMASEINDLTTYVLEAVHQIYYVLTPTASGVQDTYRGVETLRRMGHRRKLHFVLNQCRGAFDPSEMLSDLGGQLAASVPRDDDFLTAEDAHRPVSLESPGAAHAGIGELVHRHLERLTVHATQELFG
jgi:hypothetical protein